MKLHHLRTFTAASLTTLTITACSPLPEEPTPNPLTPVPTEDYVFPVELAGDYTVRWTASDGIDLTSPEATIARAISEAITLSALVGEELSYPGWFEFWETYNKRPDIVDHERTLGTPSAWRYLGTEDRYLYLLEETDNGIRAEYCNDASYSVTSRDHGETYNWTPSFTELRGGGKFPAPIYSAQLIFNQTDPTATNSTTREPSGLRAPNWNVFEGWEGVKLLATGDHHFCRDWYENRNRDTDMPEWFDTTGTPPTGLPPVKPSHPGW
ncbi:hypothetical protein IEU95_15895 [Hoyosella rhizosphaerae]|uniref:Lipoprotein n=1 Tax=Hoyosella rhizosphaerae TaxID=1755582 RepID=A0A916XJ19_9ACTN|nr:hypothetical protein [Hoyosella rhizosphaerae]MBN4928318.1 hypothetical protein [Hoyosella rhizosphaerae]GGC74050.1 hypothetical protein GCM10011410_29060 [Hoyosella rhizosphaerae]